MINCNVIALIWGKLISVTHCPWRSSREVFTSRGWLFFCTARDFGIIMIARGGTSFMGEIQSCRRWNCMLWVSWLYSLAQVNALSSVVLITEKPAQYLQVTIYYVRFFLPRGCSVENRKLKHFRSLLIVTKNMVATLWVRICHKRGYPGAACLSVAMAGQHPSPGSVSSLWHVLWKQRGCSMRLFPKSSCSRVCSSITGFDTVVPVISSRVFLWRGDVASMWLMLWSR